MRHKSTVFAVARLIAGIAFASGALPQGLPIPPAFEVESVRPHQGTSFRASPLTVSGNLIRLQGYTLFGLILDAYHVRDYRVAVRFKAKPEDLFDTMYDISAKAPGEGNRSDTADRSAASALGELGLALTPKKKTKQEIIAIDGFEPPTVN